MATETKKRNETIDIVKGFLIFLVCWVHIAYNLGVEIPMEYMFPCCMGIFFLLSGYFYKDGQSYGTAVKKKFFTLLVPAVAYTFVSSLIFFIVMAVIGEEVVFSDVLKSVYVMLVDRFTFTPIVTNNANAAWDSPIRMYLTVECALWFLFRLFFSNLIFFSIAKKALMSVRNYIISVTTLLSITCIYELFVPVHLPFLFDNCFALAAFLLTGAFIKQKGVLNYIENNYKSVKYWGVFAVVLAAYIVLFRFGSYGRFLIAGIFGKYKGFSVYICFFTTLADAYLCMVFGVLLSKIKYVSSVLKYLGKRTFTILCMHHTFASCIALLFGFTTTMVTQEDEFRIERGVTLVVSLLLCLALDYALEKIKATGKSST